MNRCNKSILFFIFFLLASFIPTNVLQADPPPGNWNLTFHDEFSGTALDTSIWYRRPLGGESIVNKEVQAYVDDAFEISNGILRIRVDKRQAQYAGKIMNYTSGIIISHFYQKYGYFEIRCKMPKGTGFWPAFWMLPLSFAQGINELDIFEHLGREPNILYMTYHWGPNYNTGHHQDGCIYAGPDFTADFHVIGLEWNRNVLIWYVDGIERCRKTEADHPGSVPQSEEYLIANLALGGDWAWDPDATTPFPAYFDIDYIRVYQTNIPCAPKNLRIIP